MATEAQIKATKKYFTKNNLVEIKVRLPQEERQQIYDSIKSLEYKSNNAFMLEAINEKLNRELKLKEQ